MPPHRRGHGPTPGLRRAAALLGQEERRDCGALRALERDLAAARVSADAAAAYAGSLQQLAGGAPPYLGEAGSDFYIIEEGSVRATKAGVDGEVSRRLTVGDYFGERALLTNEAVLRV